MNYADLHIHSIYSDGFLSPEEIVLEAIKKNIKYISITDHDTLASQYICSKNLESSNSINIIPGIEFSTEYNDIEIHILGYCIDINNKDITESISTIQNNRYIRTLEILKKLNKLNMDITIEDLKTTDVSLSYGRGNIASAIVRKGYASTYKEAFSKYLEKGKVAYVKGNKMSYRDVLSLINKSGGVSVLAHPGKISNTMMVENIIKELKCHGLRGIEVYHSSHNQCQKTTFYNFAKKYKLLITGGSDFHVPANPLTSIGSSGINETLLNKLIESR